MSGQEFHGRIGRTYDESEPWWPEQSRAREDAPNVLLIALDDTDFGQLRRCGGLADTPNVDRIDDGLRYSVLAAQGGRGDGYTLFVMDDRVHCVHESLDSEEYEVVAEEPHPEGDVTVRMEFEATGEPDIARETVDVSGEPFGDEAAEMNLIRVRD